MLKKIEDLNFYELLEIPHTATMQDIQKAYDRIRKIYDTNSIALYSLFSAEETAYIRRRIEDAYRTLVHEDNRRAYDRMLRERNELPEPKPTQPMFQPKARQPVEPAQSVQPQSAPPEPRAATLNTSFQPHLEVQPGSVSEFSGSAIRLLRERTGLTTRNIADITKISERYFQYIEKEDYSRLPARIYLRGFLIQYAKVLGVDPERLAGGYLRRMEIALEKEKASRPGRSE